tara:strand:- start:39 stop:305 length:267 start_codon:yes stop_codon:yes gene_type:complete
MSYKKNSFMIDFLAQAKAIKHEGWIIFPTQRSDVFIEICAEWYIKNESFGFTHKIKREEFHSEYIANFPLFIDAANSYITSIVSDLND